MKRGKQWDIKCTCIKGRPQNRKRNEPVHNSAYFTHTQKNWKIDTCLMCMKLNHNFPVPENLTGYS